VSHPQVGLVFFSSHACQDQPCRVLDIPENPLSHSTSHFLGQITRKYVCMYVCMHVCMDACIHACMYSCMHVCKGAYVAYVVGDCVSYNLWSSLDIRHTKIVTWYRVCVGGGSLRFSGMFCARGSLVRIYLWPTGNHFTHLIPRWWKSLNLPLGARIILVVVIVILFLYVRDFGSILSRWNCYRLGHCTTHSHRMRKELSIYDVHKNPVFEPLSLSTCVNIYRIPLPLWTFTCGQLETNIALLKRIVQWPSGPRAEFRLYDCNLFKTVLVVIFITNLFLRKISTFISGLRRHSGWKKHANFIAWLEDRMTSVESNFNFLSARPHGAWSHSPDHMCPPEPDPLPSVWTS